MNKERELLGADVLIESLIQEKVEAIFSCPGNSILPVYDSFYQCRKIKPIVLKHEQAAVHAADGYARAIGKPGVALVTSGPGVTNAITSIATAQIDSVPLVVIAGQVPTEKIGLDSFREVDIYGMTMPVTKHSYRVTDVKDMARIVKEAFYLANTGRPGPVLIEVPSDIFLSRTRYKDIKMTEMQIKRKCTTGVKQHVIEQIKMEINKAKKPVLLVGGGVVASGTAELLS